MSTGKIGELLVQKGLVSSSQIENALKAQLIFGGHLGTILIEMGFVNEEVLGATLSETSGAPYAPPKLLDNIPDPVIRTVPTRLVEEFQIVPLGLKDKVLHVAMVNPRDLAAIDALSFALNLKIVPWIAPEVRIMQAMEKYYAIPRRLRFIANSVGPEKKGAADAAAMVAGVSGGTGTADSGGDDAGASDDLDLGAEYGYGRNWTEFAGSIEEDMAEIPPPEEPSPRTAPKDIRTLGDLGNAICRADHRSEVTEVTVRYAANIFPRCLLLGVQGESASAWAKHGITPPDDWSFPVTPDGILRLLGGDSSFRGSLPKDERFLSFYKSLRIEPPADLLLVPIHVNDRLVAIFYGDGGAPGRAEGDTRACLLGLRMFTMALSLIMMKKRIRSIEDFAREASPPARQRTSSDT